MSSNNVIYSRLSFWRGYCWRFEYSANVTPCLLITAKVSKAIRPFKTPVTIYMSIRHYNPGYFSLQLWKPLKSDNPNKKSHKFIDVTGNTEILNMLISKRVFRHLITARKATRVFSKITNFSENDSVPKMSVYM